MDTWRCNNADNAQRSSSLQYCCFKSHSQELPVPPYACHYWLLPSIELITLDYRDPQDEFTPTCDNVLEIFFITFTLCLSAARLTRNMQRRPTT